MSMWPGPPARKCEQGLLEIVGQLAGTRVVTNTAGRAQLAFTLATTYPESTVHCYFLDLYARDQSSSIVGAVPNLRLECVSEIAAGDWDLAALALPMHGEAELTRDLIHSVYRTMITGGRLVAATDNPDDTWLHAEMRALFPKVTRHRPGPCGVVYLGEKPCAERKTKRFRCQFGFRDGNRELYLVTRPGVFSHRSLDGGARRLIEAMQLRPSDRVLEVGCGSGAVSLVAASRAREVRVFAVDSNPRAVACLNEASALNNLPNVTASLDADGRTIEAETCDLVLGNPPYYSHNRIAQQFVGIAHKALKPGGTLQIVTKDATWYEDQLPSSFENITTTWNKSYCVVTAQKSNRSWHGSNW